MPRRKQPCPGKCGKSTVGGRKCFACRYPERIAAAAAVDVAASGPVESVEVRDGGNAQTITKLATEDVRSLDDLIRVCGIDLSVWEVKQFVCNKWAVGSKHPETGEVSVTPLYQVKAWLQRKSAQSLTLERLQSALLADIRAEVKAGAPAIIKHRFVDSGYLFEFSPFDLHMGKYAWAEETVTNYDSDIAADLFDASLDYLLGRALRVAGGKLDRILCVFGNDVSHTDSKRGQTTAGTQMDVDNRYVRVYRRISAVHRRAINVLRQVAPVDVKIVPGNHDELTSFHLGEVLSAYFDGDEHVTIDNSARLTKYYEFGINLFGFAHGDSETVRELPLKMAREVPEQWARCPSREWHIGHKHISEKWEARGRLEQDLFSDKGVRVRRLTSLSAHDFWHTKHAYMDRRACEAFVFHRTAGFTDHLSFNVDHFTGKPAGAAR